MKKISIVLFLMLLLNFACSDQNLANGTANIFVYVERGNTSQLESYLTNGGDPNAIDDDGNSLLLTAISSGQYEVYSSLLKEGADPNYRNGKANPRDRQVVMELAAISKNIDYLKTALEYGGDPNALGSYSKYGVLFQAITSSNIDTVKLLVQSGANIDEIGENGKTPIHQAVAIKNFDIVFYLLEAGADISIKNKWGYTPVDTIIQFGDAGIQKGSDYYNWYEKVLEKLNIKQK